MRLAGVAMVRNEVDVIEAFVRHNLAVLDTLSIVDHGSFDGTSEILARLVAEGLPLRITPSTDPAYHQSETMTSLAREAFDRDRADFVFALDADEFLKLQSREALEDALSAVPAGMHVAMHWLTYVPGTFQDSIFGKGHLWWRLETERHGLSKVIVSRALLRRPLDVIAMGNHAVVTGSAGTIEPHARPSRETVALAHCPVRSRAQFESKIIIGYLANLVAQRTDRRLARHWRELYDELKDGGTFGEGRLREIASNYGLPMKKWRPSSEIALVEDPVALDFELRYSASSEPDVLRQIMLFTEALIVRTREPQPVVL